MSYALGDRHAKRGRGVDSKDALDPQVLWVFRLQLRQGDDPRAVVEPQRLQFEGRCTALRRCSVPCAPVRANGVQIDPRRVLTDHEVPGWQRHHDGFALGRQGDVLACLVAQIVYEDGERQTLARILVDPRGELSLLVGLERAVGSIPDAKGRRGAGLGDVAQLQPCTEAQLDPRGLLDPGRVANADDDMARIASVVGQHANLETAGNRYDSDDVSLAHRDLNRFWRRQVLATDEKGDLPLTDDSVDASGHDQVGRWRLKGVQALGVASPENADREFDGRRVDGHVATVCKDAVPQFPLELDGASGRRHSGGATGKLSVGGDGGHEDPICSPWTKHLVGHNQLEGGIDPVHILTGCRRNGAAHAGGGDQPGAPPQPGGPISVPRHHGPLDRCCLELAEGRVRTWQTDPARRSPQ